MQWPSDLIGYDALTSYGSPSYYAQKMFSTHHGDVVLASEGRDFPTWTWQPPPPPPPRRPADQAGTPPPPPPPAAAPPQQQVPALFYDVTRDSKSGTIILKVVNHNDTPQSVKIEIDGVTSAAASGKAIVMKAASPDDTNTLGEPMKIVPVSQTAMGASARASRATFPPIPSRSWNCRPGEEFGVRPSSVLSRAGCAPTDGWGATCREMVSGYPAIVNKSTALALSLFGRR